MSNTENNTMLNGDLQALFESAVSEYQRKREAVMKTFIAGIIDLGGILSKYREVMKESGKWMEYCDAIGTNISQANAQIRLYEYAQVMTTKEILAKVITNWAKLNLFLSLDDQEKEELLQDETIQEETTTDDFREKVSKVKGISSPVDVEVDEMKISEIVSDMGLGEDVETWEALKEQSGGNPIFENPEFAAEAIQKELKMGINTRTPLQAWVFIQKALEILQKPVLITSDERQKINSMLTVQLEQLEEFLSK